MSMHNYVVEKLSKLTLVHLLASQFYSTVGINWKVILFSHNVDLHSLAGKRLVGEV